MLRTDLYDDGDAVESDTDNNNFEGNKNRFISLSSDEAFHDPNGTRTRVLALKGLRPRPLDDGAINRHSVAVEPGIVKTGYRSLIVIHPTAGTETEANRSALERIDLTNLVFKEALVSEMHQLGVVDME